MSKEVDVPNKTKNSRDAIAFNAVVTMGAFFACGISSYMNHPEIPLILSGVMIGSTARIVQLRNKIGKQEKENFRLTEFNEAYFAYEKLFTDSQNKDKWFVAHEFKKT